MRFRPLAAALLCAAPMAHAEETLEPVIITASRTAESMDDTLAAVTVIDRQAIEQSQALTLGELLRATPGITLNVNGGRGKLTSLMLRGTGATHTLILIDGIKVGSATNGQVLLQDIPAAQIERIEVVRGPRSSLYGSEAMGGVIQIFTRRAKSAVTPNTDLTLGSYGTHELSAGVGGTHGASWYAIQGHAVNTDGFDACPACSEPDDDGYSARSASFNAGHRFASGLEAELNGFHNISNNDFDANFAGSPNETEATLQVAAGRLGYEFADFWHTSLNAGRSKDQSDNLENGVFSTRFDTVRDSASWQNDVTLGAHLLTLGFDYQADRVDSTTDYGVVSRINRGLFTQYRTELGIHDLQLAVRGDNNDQFGYYRTGNLAWGVKLADHLRLTAAYGTAFKAPTFNELYWPVVGNPTLRPETETSTEVGLQTSYRAIHLDLRLFRTDISGLIDWDCSANCTDADPMNDVYQPMNVNRARIDGGELAVSSDLGGWATRLAVTLLNPRDEATGNILRRRTRASSRLDTDRQFGAYALGATLIAEGDRYEDQANKETLAGYATLDLRGEYALASDWRLGARIENLFDQDYQTVVHYAQPGRSYYLTLSYRP